MAANRSLSEPQIISLTSVLTMRDMKKVAGHSLGSSPQFFLEDTSGKDSNAFNSEIIRSWSYSTFGVDQVMVSYSFDPQLSQLWIPSCSQVFLFREHSDD